MLNRELTYKLLTNYYWSDSRVVLGYIANESKRFHVYVVNRVQEIRDQSKTQEWNHVQSESNPADLASRGTSAEELIQSSLWWNGPEFLSSDDPLPLEEIRPTLDDNDPEVMKTVQALTIGVVRWPDLAKRLECFSDWNKACRAVALCRRYMVYLAK